MGCAMASSFISATGAYIAGRKAAHKPLAALIGARDDIRYSALKVWMDGSRPLRGARLGLEPNSAPGQAGSAKRPREACLSRYGSLLAPDKPLTPPGWLGRLTNVPPLGSLPFCLIWFTTNRSAAEDKHCRDSGDISRLVHA